MTYAKGFGANKTTRDYLDEFDEKHEDLVMCINVECERKNECLRFTETPSKYKYAVRYSKMNGENGCSYFYEPKIQ